MGSKNELSRQNWIDYGRRSRELLNQGAALVLVNPIREEINKHVTLQSFGDPRPIGPLKVSVHVLTSDCSTAIGWALHQYAHDEQLRIISNLLRPYIDAGDIPQLHVQLHDVTEDRLLVDITFDYPF